MVVKIQMNFKQYLITICLITQINAGCTKSSIDKIDVKSLEEKDNREKGKLKEY